MKKVLILGSRGLVGRALVRHFQAKDYHVIQDSPITDLKLPIRDKLYPDKPDYVIVAAGLVGGISANKNRPADFCHENSAIAMSVLKSFSKTGVKLLYLGSNCMYPRDCRQPMRPEDIWSGPPEPTNAGYAIAKRLGVELCGFYHDQYGDNFISAIPASVYGPYDNFHPTESHAVAAMIRKFLSAGEKPVDLWGSGSPIREFLYVDDLACACEHLLLHWNNRQPINITPGGPIAIRHLAELVASKVGHTAGINWISNKPDGMPAKSLDGTAIAKMGWNPAISLSEGIDRTVEWVRENPWCLIRRQEKDLSTSFE